MKRQIEKLMLVMSDSDTTDTIESSSDSDDDPICDFYLKLQAALSQTLDSKEKHLKSQCIQKYIHEVIPSYSEEEFETHFRLNKTTFKNLCGKFEDTEIFQSLRKDKRRTAEENMYVFLWFAGHEACCYRDLANRFDMCISTVGKIIERVTQFLCNLESSVIKWPDEEQKRTTSSYLFQKTGFPNVIGAIDSTRIIIHNPITQKDDYIDKQGHTSLRLQGICNENKKFMSVFVGKPGLPHNNLENSFIYPKLQNLCGKYYILGNSAYPCMEYLLTPYRGNGNLTRAQNNFNTKLSSCREIIDDTFRVLKQRFPQLYYCKLKGIAKLCDFVIACCVLHNLCNEDFEGISNYEANEDKEEFCFPTENNKEKEIRDKICRVIKF